MSPASLSQLTSYVKKAGLARGDSEEKIQERTRFVEILFAHGEAKLIEKNVIERLLQLVAYPEKWEAIQDAEAGDYSEVLSRR